MKGRKPSIAIFLVFALMAFTFFGSAATVMAQDQKTIYYTPQSQPSSISGMLEALYSSQSSAQGQQPQTAPESQQVWTGNQLDNLVAPVALYPDPLLSQMLVASTYPIEVVEANQWLQKNKNLRGKALVDAAQQQSWDSSVQALVAIPDALTKLNQDIRWTTDLGNAFLAQESDVMDAVQRMRERAQAGGRLASTPQQKITTQKESGKQAIVIEPSDPEAFTFPSMTLIIYGVLRYTVFIPRFSTPHSASDLGSDTISASALRTGEVGDIGDGAPTGSGAPFSSTAFSSTTMDITIITGRTISTTGKNPGSTIRAIG